MSNQNQNQSLVILINTRFGEQWAVKCPPSTEHPEGRIIPCHNRASAVSIQRNSPCDTVTS